MATMCYFDGRAVSEFRTPEEFVACQEAIYGFGATRSDTML